MKHSIEDAHTPQTGEIVFKTKTYLKLNKTKIRRISEQTLRHEVEHLHPLTNIVIKHELSTPYSFLDVAWTNIERVKVTTVRQRSNQGRIMTLHT